MGNESCRLFAGVFVDSHASLSRLSEGFIGLESVLLIEGAGLGLGHFY